MKIKVKKFHEDAKLPDCFSASTLFSLYTLEDVILKVNTKEYVRTGIAIEIPEGYILDLYPVPWIAYRFPNYITGGTRLVNNDFLYEIGIPIRNNSHIKDLKISKHKEIAIGIVRKVESIEFEEVADITDFDCTHKGGK